MVGRAELDREDNSSTGADFLHWDRPTRHRTEHSDHPYDEQKTAGKKVAVGTVAAVTFANGGDNIGVYVPVFVTVGAPAVVAYSIVFLALVAVLVIAARYLATRKPIAEVLERWEHVLFPIVLIGLGVFILAEGDAFGL
ncbi:cadmium resistance transporter [Rhodococcus pyridinivorans]|uniref:cadmium resistance transporter n=1 Tax=Rhodococcus pyridinivorans TaxID=103816 RepID=UPI0021FEC9FF|nr:cadmium resistance transporter [Rhodococcus pyridinivorans]